MAVPSLPPSEDDGRGVRGAPPAPAGTWLSWRWVAGAVLALAAVAGLFVAHGAEPGTAGYAGGLALSALCVAGVFGLISTAYGRSPLARVDPYPARGPLAWALGGVVAVAGLFGLFSAGAAASDGPVYYQGLAVFGLAVAFDFLLMKAWFDRPRRVRVH